jgi:hypothetical protein
MVAFMFLLSGARFLIIALISRCQERGKGAKERRKGGRIQEVRGIRKNSQLMFVMVCAGIIASVWVWFVIKDTLRMFDHVRKDGLLDGVMEAEEAG